MVTICLRPVAQPAGDSTADRIAQSLRKENNFVTLADKIMEALPDDRRRVRAIFCWITANIRFDFPFVNRGDELIKPECETGQDCAGMMREWETNLLRKIMKTRKATAEGYAKLFKRLCDQMYIPCEVIYGYARTKPYQVGNNMGANHYWNALYLDTAWLYCDPTWASGYCEEDEEGRLVSFVPKRDEYYFLQSGESFSRNHYPKKGFQVEKMTMTREQFFNKPFYFSTRVLANLREFEPETGVIKCRKGDTINFRFEYKQDIRQLQVNSNLFRNPQVMVWQKTSRRKGAWVKDEWAEKKQVYIPFTRKGNEYSFRIPVQQESLYYLELVFNGENAIRYRIRVEQDLHNQLSR